ncbi:hypothetical protein, partial [Paenibacillus faecalis]|uniref:hypothetical protein n=1 Tax=Paenibacillus faecalis TaxID=2079532 RepID=UPI00131A5871
AAAGARQARRRSHPAARRRLRMSRANPQWIACSERKIGIHVKYGGIAYRHFLLPSLQVGSSTCKGGSFF